MMTEEICPFGHSFTLDRGLHDCHPDAVESMKAGRMRIFDDYPRQVRAHRSEVERSLPTAVGGETLRAVESGRPGVVTAAGVLHLQRTAGNAAVSALIGEDQSPVLDVVGHGGGRPLDQTTRAFMESAFGEDFSGVRVHTGAVASQSAASVQALAYTVGNDIVVQDNRYSPGSESGNRMLAHELTHVVQQRFGSVEGTPHADGISVSDPTDHFERGAERTADRIMAGTHNIRTAPDDVTAQRYANADRGHLPSSPGIQLAGPDRGQTERSPRLSNNFLQRTSDPEEIDL